MTKEAYVSYEIAQLLKKKGFNVPCNSWYIPYSDGSIKECMLAKLVNYNHYDGFPRTVSRPTHQMAMKWLREKYYIYADPIKQGNYNDCSEYYTWIVARMGIIHRNSSVADKLSYEEAVEAALKYTLENLL